MSKTLLGMKKQTDEAEIVIIDGKQFITNGTWEYGIRGKSKGDGKDNGVRTLPVGQIGWPLTGAGPDDPIPLWERAALAAGEKEILRDIPRIVGGGNLINIGDLKGGSAILLAQGLIHNNLEGHVYTIDPYDDERKKVADENREESGTADRITVLQDMSGQIAPFFEHLACRFVFIDGDHSYRGVKEDWLKYSKLIVPDGLVAFHDTNQGYTDRVIKEYVVEGWKLEYWVNRIKIFSRR